MNKNSAFVQQVLCNIRGYLREPEALFWSYGFPLLMIIGLGIAFQTSSEKIVAVDVVLGPSAESVESVLREDPGFEVKAGTVAEALERLRRNRTSLVVEVTGSGELLYRYDPSNPESKLARQEVDDALQQARGRRDAVGVRDELVTAPGSRYVDFLVPGLIGMQLMGGGMWGVGFMLVDMRIKKLLKRMLGTPMRRSEFLFSVIATRIVFFVPEALVLLVAAYLIFGVPIRGSLAALAFVAFLGAMTFAGLGLLAGSRAQRIETISGILNIVMLPMWLCSGIFFSSERFPDILQPFIQALPLTQLINALRGVMLEGLPLWGLLLPLAILAAWACLSFFLALRWFRWN